MTSTLQHVIIFLVLINLSFEFSLPSTYIRIRGVKCSSSMKSAENPICFIKSNKKDVLMTLKFKLTRKVNDAKLDYRIDRITSNSVLNVFNLEAIHICSVLAGAKASPFPIVQYIIDYLKQFKSNLFEACSTTNLIEINNFTYKDFTMCSMFPLGQYFNFFKFFDDVDNNIYTLNLTTSNIRKTNMKN